MPGLGCNIHVRRASAAEVAAALRPLVSKHAFISPCANSWVTVLDEASELAGTDGELRSVGEGLSKAVPDPVLCIRLEDDDLFDVFGFEDGAPTVDERVMSNGDRGRPASDPTRRSAAAAVLARYAGDASASGELVKLLDPGAARQFKEDRIFVLTRLLGIGPRRANLSFVEFVERGAGDPTGATGWLNVMGAAVEQRYREWSERKQSRRPLRP